MNTKTLSILATLLCLFSANSNVQGQIDVGAFGEFGQGGRINGQSFTFAAEGSVVEIDSYLNIAGTDLNGGVVGTAAQLSRDAIPLDFSFSSGLSTDGETLSLFYALTNGTAASIDGLSFGVFVDAEINAEADPETGFLNETVVLTGLEFLGTDSGPQNFEVDEPGSSFGDILENLLLGSPDGVNALADEPDDVSVSLSFDLESIQAGETKVVVVKISSDKSSCGEFFLTQFNMFPASLDQLTISGCIRGLPVLSCPGDVEIECTSSDPVATGMATATSAGAELEVTWADSIAVSNCQNASVISRTWTATDDAGVLVSCVQTIAIVDNPPVISTVASTMAVQADGAGNVGELNAWLLSNGNASASDVCGDVSWSNNFARSEDVV